MRGVIVAAVSTLLSLPMRGPLISAVDVEFLEPKVQRHVGVLPLSVCKELISLGEKFGFLVREESIDEDEQKDPTKKYVPSQTIDIYENRSEPEIEYEPEMQNEAIWNVLQPWIPKITEIVKVNRDKEAFSKYYPDEPDRDPELNWIFFRKYSPNAERNSLKVHHDTNMNTVNIELSDEYDGGGLFYIKSLDSIGEIPDEYGDYEWIESVKRENTSDVVFPDLRAGDAIFYNYTVEHAVAPVERGTRYSMAFFFDMDNPVLRERYDANEENDFKVELHNGLPNVELDIVLIHHAFEDQARRRVLDKMKPNETSIYHAFEGDVLRALVAGTDEVVSDIEIDRDQYLYTISQNNLMRSAFESAGENDSEDEEGFEVELYNGLPDVELDIVRIYDVFEEQVWKRMFDEVLPNETTIYDAFEGDVLRALVAGTDEVVSDIEIFRDQHLYTISQKNDMRSEL